MNPRIRNLTGIGHYCSICDNTGEVDPNYVIPHSSYWCEPCPHCEEGQQKRIQWNRHGLRLYDERGVAA